jgi:hypothetical protein
MRCKSYLDANGHVRAFQREFPEVHCSVEVAHSVQIVGKICFKVLDTEWRVPRRRKEDRDHKIKIFVAAKAMIPPAWGLKVRIRIYQHRPSAKSSETYKDANTIFTVPTFDQANFCAITDIFAVVFYSHMDLGNVTDRRGAHNVDGPP